MRAAQQSFPEIFADSAESDSVEATAGPMRHPIESQVVERVPPSAPESSPEDVISSRPLFSPESGASHPVHVNAFAFGPPAVVIAADSNSGEGDVFVPPPAVADTRESTRFAPPEPAQVVVEAPAPPRPTRSLVFVSVGVLALVMAAAVGWLLTR